MSIYSTWLLQIAQEEKKKNLFRECNSFLPITKKGRGEGGGGRGEKKKTPSSNEFHI